MSKETGYHIDRDVEDIVDEIMLKYPKVFSYFEPNKIQSVILENKKSKKPIKIIPVKFPYDISCTKTYFFIVYDECWKDLNQTQRNIAVFKAMISIPEGGFIEEEKNYAKIRKPDYELYAEEFAVTGGVPNWLENPDVKDPLADTSDPDDVNRVPVTDEQLQGGITTDDVDASEE